MKTISVNVPETFVKGLEDLVEKSMYANRSEAIRVSIRDLLKRELYDDEEQLVQSKELRKIRLKGNQQHYNCSICKIEFQSFNDFIDHIKEEHPQIDAEKLTITI